VGAKSLETEELERKELKESVCYYLGKEGIVYIYIYIYIYIYGGGVFQNKKMGIEFVIKMAYNGQGRSL
jgi:hypothetical protein